MIINKYILMALTLLFISSLLLITKQLSNITLPDNSMIVEIANNQEEIIDLIEIKYGNKNLQETIIALQIQPFEIRRLTLNHQPGLGFNFIVVTKGKKTEVCVGKTSQSRILRQSIYENNHIEESDITEPWLSTLIN